MKIYTENELRLKILNNPNIQLEFLTDMYPRSCYQITLLEDQIRVDFGYFNFEENKDSLYFKLSDYGKTWKFVDYTYVLNHEYELFKIDERYQYIKGNVLYSKSIFPGITYDIPQGKVIKQAEELKDICDAYYIDDGSLPIRKDNFFEKDQYDLFIKELKSLKPEGTKVGKGLVRTPKGMKFVGIVNKLGQLIF